MELKAMCDSLGICLISYSPLGLGMLTGKYTLSRLPRGPRALLFRQILPGLEPLLNALKEIGERRGCNKLVHLQGNCPYTRCEDGETREGESGCSWLAPQFR
eukprot:TRINITY_DN10846_c0_g1_i1.p1 TRINITY_DN10846_c0_g1~~TRINITY_DN10846_c0_g1_i1.p1  ORF type:complete len:114 (+),score=12.18 TRINITY_DN10846_c0_g1_i1:37-342(+)